MPTRPIAKKNAATNNNGKKPVNWRVDIKPKVKSTLKKTTEQTLKSVKKSNLKIFLLAQKQAKPNAKKTKPMYAIKPVTSFKGKNDDNILRNAIEE